MSKKKDPKKKKIPAWKVVSFFLLLFFVFWIFGKYGEEVTNQEISNIEEKKVGLDPCEYLPPENAIPTEFILGEIKQENGSCSQTYSQQNAFGTSFNVRIYKCDNCQEKYDELVSKETESRGYTQLQSTENCFASRRESTVASVVKVICDMQILVFEQRVVESGWYSTSELVTAVPQSVANKVSS